MVADEVMLVVERDNRMLVSDGVVIQAAGASIMSKEGGRHFKKLIDQLSGE